MRPIMTSFGPSCFETEKMCSTRKKNVMRLRARMIRAASKHAGQSAVGMRRRTMPVMKNTIVIRSRTFHTSDK